MDEDWIEPIKPIMLEGVNVTTFNKPEEYLIRHYGKNYNKLPPDEQRRIGINKIEIY